MVADVWAGLQWVFWAFVVGAFAGLLGTLLTRGAPQGEDAQPGGEEHG